MNGKRNEADLLQLPSNIRQLSIAALILSRAIYQVPFYDRVLPIQTEILRLIKNILLQAHDPFRAYQHLCSLLILHRQGCLVNNIASLEAVLRSVLWKRGTGLAPESCGQLQRNLELYDGLADAVLEAIECPDPSRQAYWEKGFLERRCKGLWQIYAGCNRLANHYLQQKKNIMSIQIRVTILCVKDIMRVTGKSMSTAQRLHCRIKRKYQKNRADFVTIDEFCACTGFTVERVWQVLN